MGNTELEYLQWMEKRLNERLREMETRLGIELLQGMEKMLKQRLDERLRETEMRLGHVSNVRSALGRDIGAAEFQIAFSQMQTRIDDLERRVKKLEDDSRMPGKDPIAREVLDSADPVLLAEAAAPVLLAEAKGTL